MSQLKTPTVVKCIRCGKLMYVKELSIYLDDPEHHILNDMLKNLSQDAICAECKRKEKSPIIIIERNYR